jgi:hypothetical protein
MTDLFSGIRIGTMETINRFMRAAPHDCIADSAGPAWIAVQVDFGGASLRPELRRVHEGDHAVDRGSLSAGMDSQP